MAGKALASERTLFPCSGYYSCLLCEVGYRKLKNIEILKNDMNNEMLLILTLIAHSCWLSLAMKWSPCKEKRLSTFGYSIFYNKYKPWKKRKMHYKWLLRSLAHTQVFVRAKPASHTIRRESTQQSLIPGFWAKCKLWCLWC